MVTVKQTIPNSDGSMQPMFISHSYFSPLWVWRGQAGVGRVLNTITQGTAAFYLVAPPSSASLG